LHKPGQLCGSRISKEIPLFPAGPEYLTRDFRAGCVIFTLDVPAGGGDFLRPRTGTFPPDRRSTTG
jgi:hypothetical protein